MALLTTVLCMVLGYPVAYTLALKVSGRWKSALLMLVVIPFWTSFLIRTYAWMVILRTEGVVNTTLLALHLIARAAAACSTRRWRFLLDWFTASFPS